MTPAADRTPTLDAEALTTWLDAQGLGAGPVALEFLSGGAQNHIWVVRRGDWTAVLRIPPARAPESRDEGILREWKIIEGLEGSDVPHTAAIAACADTSVLGRTFYLMGYVDGWSPMALPDRAWPQQFKSNDERRGLAFALVDGVAAMAMFDWRPALSDLGRPDGYHERQVERWTRFHEKTRGRDLPGLEETTAWLRERQPRDFVPGLMHGDYQFANVMFRDDTPARLAAIVDWEMGTIGDPKLDLAWQTCVWPKDTSSPEAAEYYVDLTGMPSHDELVQRFHDATGRQVDDMDYYEVLAQWKLAIVLEQGFQRAAGDPKLAAFGERVLAHMRGAAEQAASSDYR